MGRSPCCVKEGLNRGAWTSQEDKLLKEYITVHGEGKWRSLPKRAGLKRCGKSCRLRWLNYLRPDIKRGNITDDEEDLIIRLHKLLGNRWSLIAGRLPGRTDNEIKNYWNTNISKRILGHDDHRASAVSSGGAPRSRRRRHSTVNSQSVFAKENSNTTTSNNNNNNIIIIKSQGQVQCDHHGPPRNSNNINAPQINKEGSSYVVRTKASRCTKVFFNVPQTQDQRQLGNNNMEIMKAPSINSTTPDTATTQPEDTVNISSAAHDHHFDMVNDSDKFLSDFLFGAPFEFDLDFADINLLLPPTPPPPPPGDDVDDDININTNTNNNPSCSQTGMSSASSPLSTHEEVQHDRNYSELASMVSLLDPGGLDDWLQDA